MIKSINKVLLVGNCGSDPETKTFTGGSKTSFSFATNSSYKDKKTDEWVKQTQWHNIVAWGKVSEQCNDIKKGQTLRIEGRVEYRNWTDKDGNKKYITEIIASNITEAKENEPDENIFDN